MFSVDPSLHPSLPGMRNMTETQWRRRRSRGVHAFLVPHFRMDIRFAWGSPS
jgi:hypothetical protein